MKQSETPECPSLLNANPAPVCITTRQPACSERRTMYSIRETLKSVTTLFHTWFRSHRIRIAPTEGRLLSLLPGQQLLLRNNIYTVFGTPVANPANGQQVTTRLDGDHGPAYLTIQRTSSGRTDTAQLMNEHGQFEDVFDDDVYLLNHSQIECSSSYQRGSNNNGKQTQESISCT